MAVAKTMIRNILSTIAENQNFADGVLYLVCGSW